MGAEYEWDSNKNAKNRAKHGIDFSDAVDAFNDRKSVTNESYKSDEERYETIGFSYKILKKLIKIIWTPRNCKKRLISAYEVESRTDLNTYKNKKRI